MLREYSRTQAESLAQIRASITELQHFFKGLFFIGTPCICICVVFGRQFSDSVSVTVKKFQQCQQ